jgi:MFS family permease
VRTALLAGLVGYAVSLVAVAAVTMPAWAYALRALAGFFAGAVPPLAGAFAAAEPDPVRRARLFAATGGATLVGLLAGPALSGGVLWFMQRMPGAGDMSAATLYWAMGAPAFVALALAAGAWRTPDLEKRAPALTDPRRPPSRASARRSGLFVASFLVLLGLGASEVMLPLLGPRALGLDAGSVALLFAECSAVMLAVQAALFFSPALARVPGRAVIAVGFALMAIGAAGLALARTESSAYVAIAVLAASAGWLLPAIGYLASGAGGATGTLLGALTGLGVLGQAVGSLVGGWLYDRAGGGALWLLAAVLAAGVTLAFRREFDPEAASLAASAGEHAAAVRPRVRATHPRWTRRRDMESCASGPGTVRVADDGRSHVQ